MTDQEIQDILNDLPNKRFAKLSDKQLDGYERNKNLIRTESWKNKIGDRHRGKIVSEETLKKMSEANKGKKHSEETKEICRQKSIGLNVGRKHTQNAKDKLSKSKTGTKASEETKKIMSEAQKKRTNHFSEEAIKNRRAKTLRPILCYSYPEMKFICEYESIKSAADNLNRDRGGILKILNGTIKEPRNFTFRYKEI